MSYCKEDGKDRVIFATEEDLSQPSKAIINIDEDDDQPPGLILSNGDINWDCPCLGGMATGPCGMEFRKAFSCFHYSQAEPKGSDCYEAFITMQSCMSQYPELYPSKASEDEESNSLANIEEETDSPGLITDMQSNSDDNITENDDSKS